MFATTNVPIEIAELIVFGSMFLYSRVLGPLYLWLTRDAFDDDKDLSIESIRREMIERGEITGKRSAYRDNTILRAAVAEKMAQDEVLSQQKGQELMDVEIVGTRHLPRIRRPHGCTRQLSVAVAGRGCRELGPADTLVECAGVPAQA